MLIGQVLPLHPSLTTRALCSQHFLILWFALFVIYPRDSNLKVLPGDQLYLLWGEIPLAMVGSLERDTKLAVGGKR